MWPSQLGTEDVPESGGDYTERQVNHSAWERQDAAPMRSAKTQTLHFGRNRRPSLSGLVWTSSAALQHDKLLHPLIWLTWMQLVIVWCNVILFWCNAAFKPLSEPDYGHVYCIIIGGWEKIPMFTHDEENTITLSPLLLRYYRKYSQHFRIRLGNRDWRHKWLISSDSMPESCPTPDKIFKLQGGLLRHKRMHLWSRP